VNVDAIDVDGIWWGQTPHGGDPLFRADPPSDGRWQRGETVCGLYFADSEQTAWAEWYRALSEFAIPPDGQMPRDHWRRHIDVERVADLSGDDRLAAVGLEAPRPMQRQWPAFQSSQSGCGGSDFAASSRPAQPARPGACCACSAKPMTSTSPRRCAPEHLPPAPPTG